MFQSCGGTRLGANNGMPQEQLGVLTKHRLPRGLLVVFVLGPFLSRILFRVSHAPHCAKVRHSAVHAAYGALTGVSHGLLVFLTCSNDILNRAIESITRNGISLLSVTFLAITVIYIFSVQAFLTFRADYDQEEGKLSLFLSLSDPCATSSLDGDGG